MKLLDVICARYDHERHLIHLVKEVEVNGVTKLNLTMFAPETLAARSAEYEIDDIDELVDMVVYGGHVEEVKLLNMSPGAARTLHRERTVVVKNSLAKKSSKEDKLAKLVRAGVSQEYIDAAEEDAVDVIKFHCTPDPDVVRHFKKEVSKQRKMLQETPAVDTPRKMQAKFEVLRQQELIARSRVVSAKPKTVHVQVVMNKNKRVN